MRKRVSPRVADVIRAVAEMNATYPDIAQMLAQADKQHNVWGEIALDAVPQSGRVYYRQPDDLDDNVRRTTRVGNRGQSPNLFGAQIIDKKSRRKERFGGIDLGTGVSSAVDLREEDEDEERKDDDITSSEFDDVEEKTKWYDVKRYWKWPLRTNLKQSEPPLDVPPLDDVIVEEAGELLGENDEPPVVDEPAIDRRVE